MVRVSTYVFIDTETSGIPSEELNKTKITEIALVAVSREHIINTDKDKLPRVQNKLTLCLNPRRMVNPMTTEITKLCNDLLEDQPPFDTEVYNIINSFLDILSKPICLIAYNGLNFDFPIIKTHLERLNKTFSNDLLCADAFHCMYDIENQAQPPVGDSIHDITNRHIDNAATSNEQKPETSNSLNVNQESVLSNTENMELKSIKSSDKQTEMDINDIDMAKEFLSSLDEIDFKKQSMSNERTPKRPTKNAEPRKPMKARRRFPWSDKRPKISYKLKDVFIREFKMELEGLHSAETDCIAMLKIAISTCDKFLPWVDDNCMLFSEVNPMTPGIRIGD